MDNTPDNLTERTTPKESITPEFLRGHGDDEATEDSGGGSVGVGGVSSGSVAEELGGRESAAAAAPTRVSDKVGDVKGNEENGGVNYTGSGKVAQAVKVGKGLIGKKGKIATAAILGVIVIFAVGALMIGRRFYSLGALNSGFVDTGWSKGNYAMDEQGEAILQERLAKGEVPAGFAEALAAEGIQVGQVTVAGDFISTNKYIANIEELNKIAVIGSGFEVHGEEGELAILFEGEVVSANDYLAARDKNPRLLLASDKAVEAKTKILYESKEAEEILDENTNNARSAFANWETTGDAEQDQKNFEEIVAKTVNGETSVTVAGCSEECIEAVASGDDGGAIINSVSDAAGGENTSAEQLANSALAAEGTWKAGTVFMVMASATQRSMVEGGPANEVFNFGYKSTPLTYDVMPAGEEKTVDISMFETRNFASTIGGGGFDYNEAASFGSDSVYKAIGSSSSSKISKTSVATEGSKKSDIATASGGDSVELSKATSTLTVNMTGHTSDKLTTIAGGNWVPFGGGFLYGQTSQALFGGMGGNEEKVAKYNQKTNEWEDKRIAAERATRSPFDTSSPYTFMGSIVHGLAVSMFKGGVGSGDGILSNAVGTVASLTGSATKGLMGGAMADGSGESFTDTFGKGCKTDESIGEVSTLYCTKMSIVETDMIGKKNRKDWDKWKDNNEELVENNAFSNADRRSVQGTMDAGVCEKLDKSFAGSILDFLGIYTACDGVKDKDLATGAKWVMKSNGDDASMVSAYNLYDAVDKALDDKSSTTSMILRDYYAKHPKDTSRAGRLARISGMTKNESEVALAYIDYQSFIARYDASDRYAFGVEIERPASVGLVEHSKKVNGDLYCFWRGRNEYGDVRNRSFA